ncbi:MAG: HupE/UreJ family protein [Planctomycetes bacterium]|nr:HupE/UreJ family protein [Planctomycetota bacterium]
MSSTLVASALLALGAALPLPHDPGLSSVRVVRAADALVVHAAFANADFAAAVPLDRDRDGAIGAAELAAGGAVLERAVLGGFRLRAASDWRPFDFDAAIAPNADVELTLRFGPPSGPSTLIVDFLGELSRGHRCYAAVLAAEAGEIVVDALLDPGAREFVVPAATAPVAGFGQAARFFAFGVEHILLGFDHLAFLLALLLAGVTLRRAVATITAFTVAHSLTLVAAATGLLGLPSTFVEATIAASIVWVAVQNLRPAAGGGMPHRWPLAFGFGLVHGFGFASVLADLEIGGGSGLLPLLTFNLGVELGQLLFAAVVVPLLWLGARAGRGARVRVAGSVLVGIAGVVWLAERLLG